MRLQYSLRSRKVCAVNVSIWYRVYFQTFMLIALLSGVLFFSGCSAAQFQPQPGVDYSLGFFHKIEQGDSLSAIARYYRRDAAVLARLNTLGPPYRIYIGHHLYIPPTNDLRILENPRVDISTIAMVRDRLDRETASTANGEVGKKYAERKKYPGDSASREMASVEARSKKSFPVTNKEMQNKSSKSKKPTMAAPRHSPIEWGYPLESYRYVRGYSLTNWKRPHRGVDLAAPMGTDIHCMADGTVLKSGRMGSYGNLVVVDHGRGFSSVYAHCSRNIARVGQKVRRGQTVALLGSTGRSTGPHLHFEIRYNGKAVDPEKYIKGLKANSTPR